MDSVDNQQKRLEMTFTPNTIEHLGVRMYSTVPPVLAELISNAYDADAHVVTVRLNDSGDKEIIVQDNGHGMTSAEINTKFLRIGRNRREEEDTQESPGGRKVVGKKGLGKLSFFGVAHVIEISTCKDGKRNTFILDWQRILNHQEDEDRGEQQNYRPQIVEFDAECGDSDHGTTITLRSIQRESDFDAEAVADSLSKIFIIDDDFTITVQHNDDSPISISNERKYADLLTEVEWNVPEDIEPSEYLLMKGIKGHLMATTKPISPKTNMRGITLFSRKKLVNAPEYFSDSTSSHFYSYLTGWLEVDFIDDLDDDVIGTNRQSLDWMHPETEKLREELSGLMKWLEKDWRKKRKEKRQAKISKSTGISIESWLSKMPPEISAKVQPVLEALVGESELPDELGSAVVKNVHELVPEYPKLHWRHLHPKLQAVAEQYYKDQNYYHAVYEGVKAYINEVQAVSGIPMTDRNLLENVFPASKAGVLSITEKYSRVNGTPFNPLTVQNLKEGHAGLCVAMWQAFRDPLSHETVDDLRDSGVYTEKDCLDALSLLSHLFYRLENSTAVAGPKVATS